MLRRRGETINLSDFKTLDDRRKKLQVETEVLQNERNQLAKKIGKAKADGISPDELLEKASQIPKRLALLSERLQEVQKKINKFILQLPNLPADDVTEGSDEKDNLVVGVEGIPPVFQFEISDHVDLGFEMGLDFERASKLSGSRFSLFHGDLARLHRALANFMLDLQTQENGYLEHSVPLIVNQKALIGTGQLPKFEDDLFRVEKGGEKTDINRSFLIPTAEVPLTNLIAEQIFEENELPLKYTAHSSCFRSEAGSYGKDTRGLIRQHQFEKIELVQITKPSESERALKEMVSHAEMVLKKLKLPYRVVQLCTGDMGFSASKTFDLEVWVPSQNAYREISSCSNCVDFQARRMNARFKEKTSDGKQLKSFVHTLNGSGLAVGRTLVAVMENYQREDGSIEIPSVLEKYMNGCSVIRK
jgi:seryl-tRNA synthetase